MKDDQQVGGNKILYSAYGTPYEVNLEDIKSKEGSGITSSSSMVEYSSRGGVYKVCDL